MNSRVPEFVVGQQITVTVTFRNRSTGVLVDPTTVTWRVRKPDGDEATYVYGVASQVTKTGTGTYVGTITVDQPGTFTSNWKGTGAVIGADEEHFEGHRSSMNSP